MTEPNLRFPAKVFGFLRKSAVLCGFLCPQDLENAIGGCKSPCPLEGCKTTHLYWHFFRFWAFWGRNLQYDMHPGPWGKSTFWCGFLRKSVFWGSVSLVPSLKRALVHHEPISVLCARPRGRTATQRSKKGSEKVLGRVLGKGCQKGSEKWPCYGLYTKKSSEK